MVRVKGWISFFLSFFGFWLKLRWKFREGRFCRLGVFLIFVRVFGFLVLSSFYVFSVRIDYYKLVRFLGEVGVFEVFCWFLKIVFFSFCSWWVFLDVLRIVVFVGFWYFDFLFRVFGTCFVF